LEFEFFYIQSSPFFLAVFCPFIGRVARYTPSSRPKNVTKIKANLEFQKSSDDFIINSAIVLLISLAFVYYGNQICGKKLSKYLGFM